jgi:hypothetical protein
MEVEIMEVEIMEVAMAIMEVAIMEKGITSIVDEKINQVENHCETAPHVKNILSQMKIHHFWQVHQMVNSE